MIVYESIDDEIRHHIKRADAPLRVQDGCGAGPLPRTVLQYRDQDQVRKRRQSHTMICLKPTRNTS